jgi:hypothetical protein
MFSRARLLATEGGMKSFLPSRIGPLVGSALAALVLQTAPSELFGQGCVAVRGGAGHCAAAHPLGPDGDRAHLGESDWLVTFGYRWLHSDRHFRGSHEEPQRQALGTEVINDSHFFDFSALYAFNPRFSAALTLPFVYSTRSSLYEHDRVNRHTTSAGGLGDIRLTAYAWLLDPARMPKGNLSLGIGPKFPTGAYRATDVYYSAAGPVRRAVDQSIQPGDGGWGFTTEVFGFLQLLPRTYGYMQAFYLFNPENTNGVSTETGTRRGNPFEQEMSIADQYLARAGLSYVLLPDWGLAVSLGGRLEGVPVRDAIGASDGFRRPGYAISIEPGVNLMKGKWSGTLSAPVALYRNRQRSVADERWTALSGIHRHGDAAFTDYVIALTVSRQF